jgi:hypothetical protein
LDSFASDPTGRDAAQQLLRLRFSIELLERNFAELDLFLRYLSSARVIHAMAGAEERWRRHEAMGEVLFLLHNYVAAAKSLVDHSRRVYNKLYKPSGLIPDHPSQVKARFTNDPLSQFVEDLREMAQHYRLPSIGITTSIKNEVGGATLSASLRLRVDDLLEFGRWGPHAKQFLAGAGESIDIADIVSRYHANVTAFHEWFRREQARVHGSGPEFYARVTKHGVQPTDDIVLEQLLSNVARLELRPRNEITFAELQEALDPGLTILDSRLLLICQYDAAVWMDHALASIKRRFSIPDHLGERFHRLVSP